MKSIILRVMLALAALSIVPNALAADSEGGSVFLDAKYGALLGKGASTGDVGNSGDSTTAWGADGGYLWKLDDVRSWGFEAGYMHFGQISNDTDANEFFNGNTTASAITVGVHLEFFLGGDKATIVQLRGGLAHAKFDSAFSSFPPDGRPTQSGTSSSYGNGPYLGIGIGRQLTQSFSVFLAYNNYNVSGSDRQTDLNVNWLGLEAEYRF